MQITLKNTIIASSALAVMLNLVQYTVTYNQRARASFAPSWIDDAAARIAPSPSPVAVAKAKTIVPTPAPTTANPPTTNDATAATKLTGAGLKPTYAAQYLAVDAKTGTPWQILAAVHSVETGQRGDTTVKSYAGATGPMQFMPATFAHYALDGDGDGVKRITDLDDALLTAGNYLRAGGADKGKYSAALYNYNHSNAYVSRVLGIARRLGL